MSKLLSVGFIPLNENNKSNENRFSFEYEKLGECSLLNLYNRIEKTIFDDDNEIIINTIQFIEAHYLLSYEEKHSAKNIVNYELLKYYIKLVQIFMLEKEYLMANVESIEKLFKRGINDESIEESFKKVFYAPLDDMNIVENALTIFNYLNNNILSEGEVESFLLYLWTDENSSIEIKNISEFNFYNKDKLFKFAKCILEIKEDVLFSKKYKKKCVALGVGISSKCYLAISGAENDYKGKVLSKSWKNGIEDLYDKIQKNIKLMIGKDADIVNCHLNDTCKRYVELNDETTLLFRKMTLRDTIRKSSPMVLNKLGSHYSCCERKILSYIKKSDYIDMFISFLPCNKCIPALKEIGSVCAFNLTSKEFIDELKKFTCDDESKCNFIFRFFCEVKYIDDFTICTKKI